MAWSPFQRCNAGIVRVEQPGDYANQFQPHPRRDHIRFPWPSPLGDKLTLGDICVREGHNLNSYRDSQSNWYLQHHNLAALCYGIALANRVFDSETYEKRHSIDAKMGRAVEAIDEVMKSGSMTILERHRSVFNAVRAVEPPFESEEERDFLED